MKYICSLCGYVYDEEEGVPDEGIPAGTKFEDLPEDAVGLIVNGYAQEVLAKLPMEFAVEARKLLQVSLEGSVG